MQLDALEFDQEPAGQGVQDVLPLPEKVFGGQSLQAPPKAAGLYVPGQHAIQHVQPLELHGATHWLLGGDPQPQPQ